MSMLLLLSIGCSNVTPRDWAGGGARYASGYVDGPDDTAATDTATTGGEGAPVLVTGSAVYVENEAGELYISTGIAYTDAPDDVNGGQLWYTVLGNGVSVEEGSRGCTDGSASADQALIANGQISFLVGPVEPNVSHEVVAYVVDYTRNRSNEFTVAVTGP